ncbi:MAG TPA: glycosyltransferase family A protein [Verrucomicrobiae bacterium]|nr:glycosyltransferase family A protein [Verrucomicrobiae bacterium]
MCTPSVSVIIPTFNRERCVGRAVDSVLAQTFQDIEVIVVDDGSTDSTTNVLSRFGNRIRLIRQENRGVSSARNTGIRAASGKWLAFLDSDDEWHPRKLERQVDCLNRSSAEVCFTRCVRKGGEPVRDIDDYRTSALESHVYRVDDAIDVICCGISHPQIQSLVVDKHLIEQVGLFDESLFGAEDTRLIYNLAFLTGLVYVDEPLVVIHRDASNSLLGDMKPESAGRRYACRARVQAEAYWRLLEIDPERAVIVRRRLGYFISRWAELACAANQLRLAHDLARDGLLMTGCLRDFVRCLGLYLSPRVFRPWFQRKWYGKQQSVHSPREPHREPLRSTTRG